MTRLKLEKTLLLFFILVGTCSSLCAETFRNPYRIVTKSDPASVSVADFNGDGLPDILWTDATTSPVTVHVLLNEKGGGFLPGPEQPLPANVRANCRTFDATNDGIPDLVCPSEDTFYGSIVTFPGKGDGSFGSPISSALPQSFDYANLSIFPPYDINSDAFPDLIVFDAGSEAYEVLLGDGRGGFRVVAPLVDSFLPIELPTFVTDVNGDGKPDLLIANGPNVQLGNGDGTFQFPTSYGTFPFCTFSDMDGDGHPDAVCGLMLENGGDITGGTQLFILHGNPDGSFNTTPIAVANYGDQTNEFNGDGTFLFPLAVGDQNGDGIPDILAEAGDGLTVILGKPGLTFDYPVHYATGYQAQTTFIGLNSYGAASPVDLNQDGIPDVVNPGPNGIYISYGQKGGTLDTAPAYEVTQVIGYQTVADFNEDGIPDLAASGDFDIELSLGKGDGSFKPRVALPNNSINFGTPLSATNALILSGDFNGDHHQDIIAVGSSAIYQYGSFLFFGKGNGTFSAPLPITDSTVFPMGGENVVTDVNGDGRDDVLSAGYGNLFFALSNGDGTFKTITTTVPTDYGINTATVQAFPVLADFDHNGKLDAAIGTGKKLYILKGHGDGSFDSTGFSLPIPGYQDLLSLGAQAVAVGDFDADGNPDVMLLANYDLATAVYPSPTTTVAWVYYGKGDGTLSAAALVAVFHRSYTNLYAADLNRDGLSDLIVKTSGSLGGGYAVGIVHALPSRAFGPEVNYYAGTGLADISIADLNRDGFPDLLFSNGDYNVRASSVTVLMNLGNALAVSGTLAAQPEPSFAGQAFDVIATLTPPQPAALSGPVEFYIDGKDLGSAPLTNNSATLNVAAALPVGSHALSASWQGNATYPPLTLSGEHTVVAIPATLTLASSANPADFGTSVSFTATASSTEGAPTGPVVFSEGGTTLATVSLKDGTCAFSTSALSAGSHVITATLAANGIFAASSATLVEVINGIPSKVGLSAAPDPAFVDQSVQLTARVFAASGTWSASPTGTVTFRDGATVLGNSPVMANGAAELSTKFATTGIHPLTAIYSGDSEFDPGTSGVIAETIVLNPTQSTASVTPNPGQAFAAITLEAKVTTSSGASTAYGATPTGTFVFYAGNAQLGTAPVKANTAAISTSTLGAGNYTVTAAYGGDSTFAASTSSPITLTVARITPKITLASSLNPAALGSNVRFSIVVSPNAATTHAGNGTIRLLDGTTELADLTLDANGQADFTTSQLAVGTHPITAVYAGDTNLLPGTTSILEQQIVPYLGDFSIDATPNATSLYTGEGASFQVAVTPTHGFNQPLALSCQGLPSAATCSFSPSTIPAGQGQVVLALQTSAPHKSLSARASSGAAPDLRTHPRMAAAIFAAFAVFFLPGKLRRKWHGCLLAICWISLLLFSDIGCANPASITGGTPPGVYRISVTASTAGTGQSGQSGQPLSHASVVTLTVKSLF